MAWWDLFSPNSAEENVQAGYRGNPWPANNSPSADTHYWNGVQKRENERWKAIELQQSQDDYRKKHGY